MKGCVSTTPGVLVSAPQGRSGKTVASIALCAALSRRGLAVQAFKKGPDYIDPSWLTQASGRACRNLDPFLMPIETLKDGFLRACHGSDFVVVEGAMGLYDGPDADGWGSTAHLAKTLEIPIILVVNCTRMTGSIAAMVRGYQQFDPEINIGGVILNNVSGKRHKDKLILAVEQHCKIPVVGSIPRKQSFAMTQRHLGHVPSLEQSNSDALIEQIVQEMEPHIDLSGILSIGEEACIQPVRPSEPCQSVHVRVGVLADIVFNFYYPENLDALRKAGAELVFMDSLQDQLPAIDGLYIGGGFPEFHLEALESNGLLRQQLARSIEDGLPVYAECAGLMYLCEDISWQGSRHEMVGVIPAHVELSERPQGHGYVESEIVGVNPIFPIGTEIKGHEFHHSTLLPTDSIDFAYKVKRGHGIINGFDGVVYKNVFAAYTHLHSVGTPQWADAFVTLIKAQKEAGQPMVSMLKDS